MNCTEIFPELVPTEGVDVSHLLSSLFPHQKEWQAISTLQRIQAPVTVNKKESKKKEITQRETHGHTGINNRNGGVVNEKSTMSRPQRHMFCWGWTASTSRGVRDPIKISSCATNPVISRNSLKETKKIWSCQTWAYVCLSFFIVVHTKMWQDIFFLFLDIFIICSLFYWLVTYLKGGLLPFTNISPFKSFLLRIFLDKTFRREVLPAPEGPMMACTESHNFLLVTWQYTYISTAAITN